MKNSIGQVQKGYAGLLLAALMAGCAPSGIGLTDTSSGAGDPAFRKTGPTLTGTRPVNLGASGNFVILAKSGVSTVPQSRVTGNVGVSPIARGGLTGFSETMDASNVFSRSTQVVGNLYAADYASPTPANLRAAVLAMQAAYTDAASRAPNHTELGSGKIGGMTLSPGTYKWGTGVSILSDVTLKGGPNDVWIFQISGGITQASGTRVILSGGALAQNVFWQAAQVVAIGTTAHMEGIILAQTVISLATGATVNGRLLAQTAVTLQMSAVTQP